MSRRSLFVLFSALAVAAGCGGRTSESPSTASPPPVPSGPRVYVSDEPGGRVAILDPEAGKVVRALPLGQRPRGIRLLAHRQQLLVAFSGSPLAGPVVDQSKLPPRDR